MIKVSIIILTFNRQKLIQKCLDSLYDNISSNYEIIVIDNGFTDGALNLLKKYKRLIVIENSNNVGVAAGRNIGIKKAKGKYIIFLDDDAYVSQMSFEKIIKYMEKNNKVGIIGPKILYPNGKIQESVRHFPTIMSILWRGLLLYRLFPDIKFYSKYVMKKFNHNEIKEVDWVLGACQIIRKKVFDTIGILDEKYFFGYEDIDFCYRAKIAGWKTIYYPYSTIYHNYARESAKGFINRAKLSHIKSIFHYFVKIYFKN